MKSSVPSQDERAFLDALRVWATCHWKPQERFHGEFDVAVFMGEAQPEIHPELSAALDRVLSNHKRLKSGYWRGQYRPTVIANLLYGLARRGLLKFNGHHSQHGWYDIVEADHV